MGSEFPVHGVVVVVLTFSLFLLSFDLDRLRTAGISVLVGVVVPGSGGGSEGGGVGPDVVLGFVHGSSTKELHLHVPEVQSVGIDGLHNKGGNSDNELDDDDGHGVVVFTVRGKGSSRSDTDVDNEEDPPEPEEGRDVPGVDVGHPVENVKDLYFVAVREEPNEHHRHRNESTEDEVKCSGSRIPISEQETL